MGKCEGGKLRIIVSEPPRAYPKVERSFAKAALWAAFPAAIVSQTGKIRAANRLASWIGGKDSAPSLVGSNIIDLSLHMVGEQRIPPECNMGLLVKKGEILAGLDPHQSSVVPAIFRKLREETAKGTASAEHKGASCPMFRSRRSFDNRMPWQYPVRMYPPAGFADRTLLEFAVLEVQVGRDLLIVLEPDDALTKDVIAQVYAEYSKEDSDGQYVFGQAGVDTTFPEEYDRGDLTNPEIEIIYISEMVESEIESKKESVEPRSITGDFGERVGLAAEAVETTVFALQPDQTLSVRDRKRIARAINAEDVTLPVHPELGPGHGFRLRADAAPGRVTQIDVYQRRSTAERAVVRVHRTDDFGDPYAPRYMFDVGYIRQGAVSALAFHSVDDDQQRIVTIYIDGRVDEDVRVAQPARAVAVPTAFRLDSGEMTPSEDAARQWLTMGEAIALMDISWSYARKLIADGALNATRRGKVWFIDPDSARSFQRKRLRPSG